MDPDNKSVLKKISDDELKHYDFSLLSKISFSPQRHGEHGEDIFLFGGGPFDRASFSR
jgi:hypothetical protein